MKLKVVHKSSTGWAGVPEEGYREGAGGGVVRHTLVGGRKRDAAAPGPSLELRYFEVSPGAASRLEKHEHEHTVVIGAGEGYAVIGTELHAVGPHDVVYIGPLVPHQFINRGAAPFGFFCAVDAARDASQELSAQELAALQNSPAAAVIQPEAFRERVSI